jgi:hypothetical protein
LEGFHGRKVFIEAIPTIRESGNSQQPRLLYQRDGQFATWNTYCNSTKVTKFQSLGGSMKAVSKCLVFVMVLSAAALFAQAPQPPQAPTAPPTQAQQEKTFEGSLVKVDADAKMLIATGPDNKEWEFTYTDRTQVTGAEKNVQGLAGKSGAKLRIMYRAAEKGANEATRIEILPERATERPER